MWKLRYWYATLDQPSKYFVLGVILTIVIFGLSIAYTAIVDTIHKSGEQEVSRNTIVEMIKESNCNTHKDLARLPRDVEYILAKSDIFARIEERLTNIEAQLSSRYDVERPLLQNPGYNKALVERNMFILNLYFAAQIINFLPSDHIDSSIEYLINTGRIDEAFSCIRDIDVKRLILIGIEQLKYAKNDDEKVVIIDNLHNNTALCFLYARLALMNYADEETVLSNLNEVVEIIPFSYAKYWQGELLQQYGYEAEAEALYREYVEMENMSLASYRESVERYSSFYSRENLTLQEHWKKIRERDSEATSQWLVLPHTQDNTTIHNNEAARAQENTHRYVHDTGSATQEALPSISIDDTYEDIVPYNNQPPKSFNVAYSDQFIYLSDEEDSELGTKAGLWFRVAELARDDELFNNAIARYQDAEKELLEYPSSALGNYDYEYFVIYNNIGFLYAMLSDYANAIDYLEKAKTQLYSMYYIDKRGNQSLLVNFLKGLSSVYRQAGQSDKANLTLLEVNKLEKT